MNCEKYQRIVIEHYSRYPLLQVEDLYKLAHQGALGSEHAIQDITTARNWLVREIDDLPESSAEPIAEEISPENHIIRIHLKPYLEASGDPENLLAAFFKTANEFHGSIGLLKEYWRCCEDLAKQGIIGISSDKLSAFFASKEAVEFPAVHHSEQYKHAYHPGYRVIKLDFLQNLSALRL
jgi:hypothetical protein